MTEKLYRIAIVDDQWSLRRSSYNIILGKDNFSSVDFIEKNQLEPFSNHLADAWLVDVNLNEWGAVRFGMNYLEWVLTLIPSNAPVFLISSQWAEVVSKAMQLYRQFPNILGAYAFDSSPKRTSVEMVQEIYKLVADFKRQRPTFNDTNPQQIKILHISDLQYGDKEQLPQSGFDDVVYSYFRDRDPGFDFLAVTGDLTYNGARTQFDDAKILLKRMAERLICHHTDKYSRILLTPGNHDFNRGMASHYNHIVNTATGEWVLHPQQTFKAFEFFDAGFANYRNFAYDLTGDENWLSNRYMCFVNSKFSAFGLRFLHLNTFAANCINVESIPSLNTKELDWLAKIGVVVQELNDWIVKEDASSPQKISTLALNHHSLLEGTASADTEENRNARGSFRNLVNSLRVRMSLSGHNHRDALEYFPVHLKNIARVPIIQAGSALMKRERRNGERSFNKIVLKKQDGILHSYEVTVCKIIDNCIEAKDPVTYPFE